MKICPRCQTRYENAIFCTQDGSPLVDTPADAASLAIGTVLENRYRIVSFLGAGGMGEVYRAEHIHIVKTVAIKLLKPEITGDLEALARFKREAMLASRIEHPAIVRIEDFGELPDGRVYMAMEYLEGEPLSAAFRTRVDIAVALSWMKDVAYAMAAAHEKGIVHRDLKPENVFIARQNGHETVKIVDFGIAKMRADMSLASESGVAGNVAAVTLTCEGRVFGTPYYMSPEQALGIEVDARTDIYAMGIMLYELLTGRVPFSEGSFMKILFMQVNEPPPPLEEVAPHVPAFVSSIVHQALEKEPGKRQSSVLELARQLENALHELQKRNEPALPQSSQALEMAHPENIGTEPETTNTSSRGKTPAQTDESAVLLLRESIHGVARHRRRMRIMLFGAAIFVLAAGFAWFWLWRQGSEDAQPQKNMAAKHEPPPAKPPSPAKTFAYDCPSESSSPMGFTPAALANLQESRRTTLRLPCSAGRCRILASPVVEKDILVAAVTPGQVLAWKADTLDPLWQAPASGDIVASPLIWGSYVVTASKDKRIRLHALDSGRLIFESPASSEYFTATPFISRDRVLVPAWDHSFHVLEPFLETEPAAYFPRKIPVQGILMHSPTRVEGNRWFFAGTRILTRGRYVYTFYIPVDGDTFSVQPENKIRLCVVGTSQEDAQDPRVVEQCQSDAIVVDALPTLSAYPPLVTTAWAWFFLYGGSDTAPEGIVVLCSRTEGRCWRVLRAGTYGRPTAGRIHGRPFGVFTLYRNKICTLCGFYLDQSFTAGEDSFQCLWKKEIAGCPGDLRWMGEEIVFGTNQSRLLRISAASGDVLQEVRLSGRASSAPVRCKNRLFIGTLDQSIDVFDF